MVRCYFSWIAKGEKSSGCTANKPPITSHCIYKQRNALELESTVQIFNFVQISCNLI